MYNTSGRNNKPKTLNARERDTKLVLICYDVTIDFFVFV